ncbi:ribosome biogenesis protein NOP53 [Bacillus rossius redtenbacheri]|uniref:ribosome biogenesis protein NOP53 n=1 Tax=Bacillus rossius redtenbacheri TaxID=93214 RepID=UPI002FDE1EF7
MAPAKKRVSKKLKKSWRKHVDITDVEGFLDDKLLEERLGTPFTERQNEELFSVDKEKTDVNDERKRMTKKQKREELKNKPFRCFEILTARSKVPDPVIKRNRVRTPDERKSTLVKKIEADRLRQGIVKKKYIIAQKNRELAKLAKKNVPKIGTFKNDLWVSNGKPEDNPLVEVGEWFKPTTVANLVKNTRLFKKQPPKSVLNKPTKLNAIEAPHPGTSYNPSYADHQALLKKIAETELEIIKQEKHLERVTTKMFSRVSVKKAEADWFSEMSEGLPFSEKIEVKDEPSDDDEYRAVNPPTQNKKKTLKKRRKLKEAREEEKARIQAKIEKKKTADIYQLRFLQQRLKEAEARLADLQARREKARQLRQLEPKKLSRMKFEPLELEFNLASELGGNLRSIKPQGSLLKSRFNSLQMRNIIEPGSKHAKHKSKVKWFKTNSHKMDWEI